MLPGKPRWRGQDEIAKLFMKEDERKAAFGYTRPLPDLRTFITSPDYMGQMPLSERQFKALNAMLGEDPTAIFTDLTLPNEGVLAWGKGAGKDYIISLLVAYLAYVLLCMENTQEMLGLGNDEPIDIVNVASNAQQSRDVFFTKLRERIKRPCFAEFLAPRGIKRDVIEFKNGIRLQSLHSANEAWEGKNILVWVMDEASAFRTVNGADNADQVYKTLRSSARTRFMAKRWIGMVISFPRKQQGDFTINKYTSAIDGKGHIYADRAATWDIHPMFDPEHPMYDESVAKDWVTIEALNVTVPRVYEQDFLEDGIDALTKYMAEPPLTEGGFFENPDAINEAVADTEQLPTIITKPTEREEILDNGSVRRYVRHEIESLPPVIPDAQYFMHGDPGLKQDAFALCLVHTLPEWKTVVGEQGEMQIQRIECDFVLTWEPRYKKHVDLLNVEDTIMLLAKHYNVTRVTFDRWNSAQSIQRLVSYGIDAEDMSFSNPQQYAMYRYLRLCFYNGMIRIPDDRNLQNELKFLRDNNGKLEHDIHGKDRADALAAAVWNAAGKEYSRVKMLVRETLHGKRFGGPKPKSYGIVRNAGLFNR